MIEEHREAIEYDLLRHGLRLRDLPSDRLTWRDLKIILNQQPIGESAYVRETQPDAHLWSGLVPNLLALLIDQTAAANWQRGGNKHAPRPKPLPRPGLPNRSIDADQEWAAIPLDEIEERLYGPQIPQPPAAPDDPTLRAEWEGERRAEAEYLADEAEAGYHNPRLPPDPTEPIDDS